MLTKGRECDALEAYFKMPVAEFGRISQHDRRLMAVRIISIMAVAMVMAMIVVMVMVVMVARVVPVIAMDMRMVAPAMAMIERAHVKPT
jgi:hypothetical protein